MTNFNSKGSFGPNDCKECTKCLETKPFTNFHASKSCKGGYRKICKACVQPRNRSKYLNNQIDGWSKIDEEIKDD